MNSSLLVDWTPSQYQRLEHDILLAQHRLHESPLFSNEGLVRLLDTHPADCLHVNTMGYDHRDFQWQEGDRNGVPGEVLLDLVQRGRLWINLRNLMQHQPVYRNLINELFDSLERCNSRFKAHFRSANLLISSPGALVHYHVDIPVNMLWHLRGIKRVWVYPPFDFRFVSQDVLERVFSGDYAEDVPYFEWFDEHAQVFDVRPGQMLTWPQNTPHRVTNQEGLNVSLSTEHRNPMATRRINVHLANQWLRNRLGKPSRGVEVSGPWAHLKENLIRGVRYATAWQQKPKARFVYPKTFRVNPDAPLGFSPLTPQPAERDLVGAL